MRLVSSVNEINYGSYDEGLDWNIQNYQIRANNKNVVGKKAQQLLSFHLRFNIFTPDLQAEIEFLKNGNSLRIMLLGYDIKHDLYIEKSWMLSAKQFAWGGNPEKYQIVGKGLGLDFDVTCDGTGLLHFHFSYFDHYQVHFVSHIHRTERKPLRNVNPFDFDTWRFNEKHAMLDCRSIKLVLDGNEYSRDTTAETSAFNLSYEWSGGYFPQVTKELRCEFWQQGCSQLDKSGYMPEELAELSASALISEDELQALNLQGQMSPQNPASRLLELAGSLLMMGHDCCSSESAVWVEEKIRYRLSRIIPSFGRSAQTPGKNGSLLPDLEWTIHAGKHLDLCFRSFSLSEPPKMAFPLTQTQRIYGLFYGKLQDQFGDVIPIQKALGFIDYRSIQWRNR